MLHVIGEAHLQQGLLQRLVRYLRPAVLLAELHGREVAGGDENLRSHVQGLHTLGDLGDAPRGDGVHQRRLARAVAAHNAVTVALLQLQRGVREEEVAATVHHAQVLDVDQRVGALPVDGGPLLLVLDALEDLAQRLLHPEGAEGAALGLLLLGADKRRELLLGCALRRGARPRLRAAGRQHDHDVFPQRVRELGGGHLRLDPLAQNLRAERLWRRRRLDLGDGRAGGILLPVLHGLGEHDAVDAGEHLHLRHGLLRDVPSLDQLGEGPLRGKPLHLLARRLKGFDDPQQEGEDFRLGLGAALHLLLPEQRGQAAHFVLLGLHADEDRGQQRVAVVHGEGVHAEEVLAELHRLGDLLGDIEEELHREGPSLLGLEVQGLLQARQEKVGVRSAILVDQHLPGRQGLLRDDLRLLVQGVQHHLQALGHERDEGLRAEVRDEPDEGERAGLRLVGLAGLDPRDDLVVEVEGQEVPSRQQHLGQALGGPAALHLGDVPVRLLALHLREQVRQELLRANHRQPRGQASEALRGLPRDAVGGVDEALLQERQQLCHVGLQDLGVGDEIHGGAHDLDALHLRLVRLLAHGAGDDGEDQAEGDGVHGVHEGRVAHLRERLCRLGHVGAVHDALDDGLGHSADLRVQHQLLAHVAQEGLGRLLHLLPGISDRTPHSGHHPGHPDAQLLRAALRLDHPLQHLLDDAERLNLHLPLPRRAGAEVVQQDGQHQLGHSFAARAGEREVLAEVHNGAPGLGLQLGLLEQRHDGRQGRQDGGRVPQQGADRAECAIARRCPLHLCGDQISGAVDHAGHLRLHIAAVEDRAGTGRKLGLSLLAALHGARDHPHDLGVDFERTGLHLGGLHLLVIRLLLDSLLLRSLLQRYAVNEGFLLGLVHGISPPLALLILQASHVRERCLVVPVQLRQLDRFLGRCDIRLSLLRGHDAVHLLLQLPDLELLLFDDLLARLDAQFRRNDGALAGHQLDRALLFAIPAIEIDLLHLIRDLAASQRLQSCVDPRRHRDQLWETSGALT
mmetsp:Transcript_560/g.1555  ORF Transcript_560/g.1555 Transcript_560/m.1555 type:complete len:1022 (-) Transcript_560:26-3091(-)